MRLNLHERRYKTIWDLRNAGQEHRQIARQLGMATARVRALIAESMNPQARYKARWGEFNTPEHFYWHERFTECPAECLRTIR